MCLLPLPHLMHRYLFASAMLQILALLFHENHFSFRFGLELFTIFPLFYQAMEAGRTLRSEFAQRWDPLLAHERNTEPLLDVDSQSLARFSWNVTKGVEFCPCSTPAVRSCSPLSRGPGSRVLCRPRQVLRRSAGLLPLVVASPAPVRSLSATSDPQQCHQTAPSFFWHSQICSRQPFSARESLGVAAEKVSFCMFEARCFAVLCTDRSPEHQDVAVFIAVFQSAGCARHEVPARVRGPELSDSDVQDANTTELQREASVVSQLGSINRGQPCASWID